MKFPKSLRGYVAYGIPAIRISDNSEIDGAIDRLFNEQGIFLLECTVAPNETTL